MSVEKLGVFRSCKMWINLAQYTASEAVKQQRGNTHSWRNWVMVSFFVDPNKYINKSTRYTLFFSLPLFTRSLFIKHFSSSIICFDKNQSPLISIKRNILEYRSTQCLDLCEINQESLWALSWAITRLTYMNNNVWTNVR